MSNALGPAGKKVAVFGYLSAPVLEEPLITGLIMSRLLPQNLGRAAEGLLISFCCSPSPQREIANRHMTGDGPVGVGKGAPNNL